MKLRLPIILLIISIIVVTLLFYYSKNAETNSFSIVAFTAKQDIAQRENNFYTQASEWLGELKDEELPSIIVVNFWASWCEPCVKELKDFTEIAKEKFPRMRFVAIGVGETDESIQKFKQKNNMGDNIIFIPDSGSQFAAEYGVNFLPVTFFVPSAESFNYQVDGIRNWLSDEYENFYDYLINTTKGKSNV